MCFILVEKENNYIKDNHKIIRYHRIKQQVEQKSLSKKCQLGRDYILLKNVLRILF